jgi:carbon storage regulator
MLVLARKPGEKILVGEIEFEIVAIRGGKVRVGVTAPRDTPIARGELVDRTSDNSGHSLDETGS